MFSALGSFWMNIVKKLLIGRHIVISGINFEYLVNNFSVI
jgi:hypothetical protein